MTLTHALELYGYWVVLLGTFLEGETVLVLAGYLAHRGYMNIWLVILAAIVGSYFGDQLFFALGRRYGRTWLERRPHWHERANKVLRLLERWDAWFIVSFRFFYGLRTVSSAALGLARVGAWRFAALNGVGAIVWAISFGWAGFLVGKAVSGFIDKLSHGEWIVLGVLAGIGIIIWAVHTWRERRAAKRDEDEARRAATGHIRHHES